MLTKWKSFTFSDKRKQLPERVFQYYPQCPRQVFFFLLQKEWITDHAGGSLGAGAEAVRGGGGPAKPRQCPVPGTGLAAQREAAGGPGPASLPRKAGPSSGAHRRCRLALSGPRQRRGEGSDRNRRPTSGKRRVEGGAAAAPRPASRSAALARLLSLRTASSRAARKSPPRPHRPAACRTRAARPLTAGLGRARRLGLLLLQRAAAANSLRRPPRQPRAPHSPGGCWCSPWAPPGRPARSALQSPFKSPAHGRPARANGALASSVRDVTHNNAPPAVGGTSVQPANSLVLLPATHAQARTERLPSASAHRQCEHAQLLWGCCRLHFLPG